MMIIQSELESATVFKLEIPVACRNAQKIAMGCFALRKLTAERLLEGIVGVGTGSDLHNSKQCYERLVQV